MSEIKIPIASPIIGDEEIEEVVKVLKSGFIAQGPKVAEFEEKFAEFVGAKYGVATSSGTTALHVALLCCGIGEGDEVITTPFTFAATGNSILYTGARPKFVDIDPDTFNIDPDKIEEAINEKTKAIMPVQLYGQSADMDKINEIVKKHELYVIEDAAQAHGAIYKDKKVGTMGDMGCFSFYPTKNMTTSEGGMITTNNEELAEKARMFRAHGETKRYEHAVLGYNFRMTDVAAAIGIAQMKKIDEFNQKRINNATYLTNELEKIDGINPPKVLDGVKHVYHQYTIKIDKENRDDWVKFLNENGVGTGIHYPIPTYKQELYLELGYDEKLPETEKATSTVISLPIHPKVTEEDLTTIVKVLKEASNKFN
ncbi:UDP-4-amino-4-deoxy-L-arabinose--oxoglutarate aminotransferase [Candidatus Methanobinarius endosymbioticus]|uniref:UDP-4-amino-4-deoxy-L-arabinose--oxoglutarate aminotransferase n=1 Tax=Candidatus Methanobinarius endosymbioticus TaxID=2006182 RepID=A0A366M8F9_9EURY|nr:UDP-4-amino-4-deoxy-L-arabinose--oxoglutarate aminotransferase [Candidatus Methanobinarius endosymbioticus]